MSAPNGAVAPKSEMQKDVDGWVKKANEQLKDVNKYTQPAGESSWSSGFFECFNPIDSCLITYFCPCVTFGRTHHRLNKDAHLEGWNPVNASCLGWWASACFGVHCIGTLMQKNEIAHRSQPKLETNIVTDFLKAWCCHCCDLIQQDKEAVHLLAKEEEIIMHAPQKQEAMNYA